MNKVLLVSILGMAAVLILAGCTSSTGEATAREDDSGQTVQNLSIIIAEGKIIGGHVDEEKHNGEEEAGAEEEAVEEHDEDEVEEGETIGEFHRWEPSTLVVHKGDKVVLTVTNPRKNAHSLVLPDFDVNTSWLEPEGGTATVEFTADKAGVFRFACGMPYDEASGICAPDHESQVGYLIVLNG